MKKWCKRIVDMTLIFWAFGLIPYIWEITVGYKISIFERNAILILLAIFRIVQFDKFDLEV